MSDPGDAVANAVPECAVTLLGGFGCRHRGEPVALPTSAQRVVVFLAIFGPHLSRAFLAGSLWPDLAEARAAAALRKQLWLLGRERPWLVLADRTTVRLAKEVEIDLDVARHRLRTFLDDPPSRIDDDELVAIGHRATRRPLLPGWDEAWLAVEQERWRQLRVHALEKASALFGRGGQWSAAVDAALAAVEVDPDRESAVRLLVDGLRAQGNSVAAVRVLQRFEARILVALESCGSDERRRWLEAALARVEADARPPRIERAG